jgi:hypothetical protein
MVSSVWRWPASLSRISAAADPTAETFYRELRPISEEWYPAALRRQRLTATVSSPTAPTRASRWAELVAW